MHYNVQPWVGALTWTPEIRFFRWEKVKGGISKVFALPALKEKKVVGESTKKTERRV